MIKSKYVYLLSSILIIGAIIIGFYFKDSIQNANAASTTSNEEKVTTQEEPAMQNLKETIQDKMFNSIDYFDKAQGSFIYGSNAIGDEYIVDYNVKTKNGIYSNIKVKAKESSFETEYNQAKKERTLVDHIGKSAIKSLASDITVDSTTKGKLKDKLHKNERGEKVFERREDSTYMGGLAATSLFPQDIAASFLEDYNNWNIISTNENMNGLEAVLIEGNLSEYFQAKHNATKFKLWVHQDTGILLAMEEYNDSGVITEYIKTIDIKLNDKANIKNETISIPANYNKVGKFEN
jgi:hypothetical protein